MHATDSSDSRPIETPADHIAPSDLKINRKDATLTVTWKDGHVSVYDLAALRKACPCAGCNVERREQTQSKNLFPILTQPAGPPRKVTAQLIGTYAIQFNWPDGHNTGLYDFKYLRSLDSTKK